MTQKTIFETQFISRLLHKIAVTFFRMKKWKLVENVPSSVTKAVVVAAPHTSGFDLPYIILLSSYFNLPIRWVAKEELFIRPFRQVLVWLGGIPVKRNSNENKTVLIGKMLRKTAGRTYLVIAPSGTRKNIPVQQWHKGYYNIALYAGVPILFAYIDYTRREACVSFPFAPTGDYDEDVREVEKFYRRRI